MDLPDTKKKKKKRKSKPIRKQVRFGWTEWSKFHLLEQRENLYFKKSRNELAIKIHFHDFITKGY